MSAIRSEGSRPAAVQEKGACGSVPPPLRSRAVSWAVLFALTAILSTTARASRVAFDDGVCAFGAPAVDPVWTQAVRWTADVSSVWPRRLDTLRIYVPRLPSADEITTAFALVAGAARHASSGRLEVVVEMLDASATEPLASASPYERTIVVGPASGRGPRLVRGIDASTGRIVPVLAIDALGPETVVTASGFDDPADPARDSFTFRELGYEPHPLGPTRTESAFRFSEADLGRPVASASLHIRSTHAAPPVDATNRLAVLVNGGLVDLVPLGDNRNLERTVRIPSSLLRRDNEVLLRLVTAGSPWSDREEDRVNPFEVLITDDSYLEVERGQRLTAGFERFPQALVPSFDVSFDRVTPSAMASAAQVVVAMQRHTSSRLHPRVVPWEQGRFGRRPWLAVSQDRLLAASLDPPLPPGPFRIVDGRGREAFRSADSPHFAALQAFTLGERDVLLLTHNDWPDGLAQPGLSLAAQRRWDGLSGEVWLVPRDGMPFALRLGRAGLVVENLSATALPAPGRARDLGFLAGLLTIAGFLAWSYPRLVRSGARRREAVPLATPRYGGDGSSRGRTGRRRERTVACP